MMRSALVFLCLVAHVKPAYTCGNAVGFDTVELVRVISNANASIEVGKYEEALDGLRALRIVRVTGNSTEEARLVKRARVVWLKAVVRSPKPVERSAFGPGDLEGALKELDMMKNEPAVAELRAEAMARFERTHEGGIDALAELARNDLLTAPESWAVLADGLDARGLVRAGLAAHVRCAEMARDAKVQCRQTTIISARRAEARSTPDARSAREAR